MTERYWTSRNRAGTARIGRRRFVSGTFGVGAGFAALASFGCGDDDSAPATSAPGTRPATSAPASPSAAASSPTAAAAKPKPGGNIVVNGVNNLDAPNPDVHLSATQLLSSYGIGMAYSRLVRFKIPPESKASWNGEYALDLAASVEQPDATTVLVKIRPNAKFHNIAPVNGRAATAQDVVYSFNRQISSKTNATQLPPWSSLEAVDATSLRFKLKAPNAEFVPNLALYWNKVVAKEAVDIKGHLKEGPTIGTGPWILKEWKTGQQTVLTKNPDYFFPGLPYADTFTFLRIPDLSTQLAALRNGQIMECGSGINPDVIEQFKGDKNVVSDSYQRYGDSFVNFKVDAPPFNDPRLRQAVFRAINYEQIHQVAFVGAGYTTGGIGMPAPDWELPQADLKNLYKTDIAMAKSLLQAAGQPNLSLQMHFINLAPQDKVAQLVQQQLKLAGIETTLVPLDNLGYIALALTPNSKYAFVVGTGSTSPLTTADVSRFYTGSSRNGSNLSDTKLDALIDKQSQTLETAARKATVLEMQKQFHDNYYQWATGQQVQRLRSASLKGMELAVRAEYDAWTRAWIDKA